MKKILFAAMAICVGMTSCMNEDFPYAPNYGYINVNVTNDPVISTRATVTGDDLKTWTIMAGNYKLNDNNKVPAGTYTVTASNYESDVDALGANDNWGDAFYTGSTENVKLVAGQTKEVSIDCGTAKNSRLKVVFALDNNAFTDYSLVADRNLTFTNENMSKALAYYNVGQDAKVGYTLKYTYGGAEKSMTGTIAMTEAATEYKLSISSNNNGTITITQITYDDTFTEVEGGSIEFDAATGEVIAPENDENVQE